MPLCDCDQSFEVHPPGYHARSCCVWGPRYDLPDAYEFAFVNVSGVQLDKKKIIGLLTSSPFGTTSLPPK